MDRRTKTRSSKMFNEGATIDELTIYFERTKGAIKSELMHQGLIDQS